MIALYKFRFYELDQPLEVGAEREFTFFVDPHFSKVPASPIYPSTVLVFANTLSGAQVVKHYCRIQSIMHPQLGSVLSIATDGFDYKLKLQDESVIEVNAEENSGQILNSLQQVDWAFVVEIQPLQVLGAAQ